MIPLRYLVIEGPIGVGKTTLAERLGARLDARLVLERVEDNPFLKSFYSDRRATAFQTQLFFLLSRYRQQESLTQDDLFAELTISDYFFLKDRLFARLNLTPEELDLYDQVYRLLGPRVPRPDLVVYLQADTDTLLRRIESRGREYERDLTVEYLEEVNRAYNDLFFHYDEGPLLVVRTEEIDPVHDPADLEELIRQLRQPLAGTRHYIPKRPGI